MIVRLIASTVLFAGLAACSKYITDKKSGRPLPALAGSEWGPVTDGAAEQFVAFKSGGEIIGSGGCNNFFGSYEQDGQGLTIGPLASTKKMCHGVMDAEADFVSRLQRARTIEATHISLSIFDEAGLKVLNLRRRDWD